MLLITMVARVADGLPLAASIQQDDQVRRHREGSGANELKDLVVSPKLGKAVVDYQNQAKRLFKTLTPTSPNKCSIESGPYLFQ